MAGDAWEPWLASTLETLERRRVLRALRPVAPISGTSAIVRLDDRDVVLFAANDYLGMSAHPDVRRAAESACRAFGCGPRASALVAGYTHAHAHLEAALARLKGTEEALLFPTGYAANTALLGALADGPGCAIFSDELNHASIVDGARLAARGSSAELHVFSHASMDDLERRLAASSARRKLIISDSVFSMDGDVANVEGLVRLRDAHGALLVLDEAHGTLVFGDKGGGVAEAAGLAHRVDVHVGTLSKAFGAHGGFVGCSRRMKDLLASRGRPGIFSTALPLPAVAAAAAALTAADARLRRRLWANVDALSTACGRRFASPIAPIVLGSEQRALDASAALLAEQFWVPAIRPPTVPAGTSRLRVALSADHSLDQVQRLGDTLRRLNLLGPAFRARASL